MDLGSDVHIGPSGKPAAMKTCPVCLTKAFLATRQCKGVGCGYNFVDKTIERTDGGSAARQQQERRRAAPPPASVVTVMGNVTSHSNIDPEDDGNIDTCIICGDMGMLICCDMCPLSYHADCAGLDKVPSGYWCCPQCTQKNLALSAVDAAGGRGVGVAARNAAAAALPLASGIQSGLDPFHQKLNACLDYTNTQTYECDGYTFMCFLPPDLQLLSSDPVKQAAAQARFDAIKAEHAKKEEAKAQAAALAASPTNVAASASTSEPMKTE